MTARDMEFIPAKERFSTNIRSVNIGAGVLRDALSSFGRPTDRAEFRRLSGGFMNANYLAEIDKERVVVRVYSTDAATADRECDLLTFLASAPILTPRVLARFQVQDHPVAILEFVDGITLEDRLLTADRPADSLYHEIGAQLATIHSVTFLQTGFLGPQLEIGHEYDDFSAFIRRFIERTLSMLLTRPDRLSVDLNHRLQRLVHDTWTLVSETEPRRQLVHCDFNPKNLLVSAESVSGLLAVVDWEFCLSGNGLGDLGNFFRFEYDYPGVAREIFAAGYRSVDPDLPENWFDVAKLIDLGNMCAFLERPEDYQETCRTARAVIRSTLEHFGY
jgi:Ser/Thr protein kinase RdoA (MazF antagonist)